MKKYDVKVEKIITTVFTLEAKNKMEAEEMARQRETFKNKSRKN